MFQPFQIEEEADARYEGFDFDDVDDPQEKRVVSPFYHDELRSISGGEEDLEKGDERVRAEGQEALDVLPGNENPNLMHGAQQATIIKELAQAEKMKREAHAAAGARARLISRLNGEEPASSGIKSVMAPLLLKSQGRISSALKQNVNLSSLKGHEDRMAAEIVVNLIPEGTSEATTRTKIANAVRKIGRAGCVKDVYEACSIESVNRNNSVRSDKSCPADVKDLDRLVAHVERCSRLEDPPWQEAAVRALLRLAAWQISEDSIRATNAGKRIRIVSRQSSSRCVTEAARIVVSVWKRALLA